VSSSKRPRQTIVTTTQDTLARKVNSSDASEYAMQIGFCSSRFWGETKVKRHGLSSDGNIGAFWLLQAAVCK